MWQMRCRGDWWAKHVLCTTLCCCASHHDSDCDTGQVACLLFYLLCNFLEIEQCSAARWAGHEIRFNGSHSAAWECMERQCADRSQVSYVFRNHVLWLQCLYEKVLVAGGWWYSSKYDCLSPTSCMQDNTRDNKTRQGKSRQDKMREWNLKDKGEQSRVSHNGLSSLTLE